MLTVIAKMPIKEGKMDEAIKEMKMLAALFFHRGGPTFTSCSDPG